MFHEGASLEMLHLAVAREAEVRAVETHGFCCELLEACDAVDHAVLCEVALAGEGDDVAGVPIRVRVAGDLRDWFARVVVCEDLFRLEGDFRRIVGDDLPVFREHENRDRLVVKSFVGGDVRRDDRVGACLAARPIPVVHDVH